MKWERFQILGAALLCGALVAGCSSPRHAVVVTPTGKVVVPYAPPPARWERSGAAPTAGYSWAPGYWTHPNDRWVWIPGRWQAPPQTGMTWQPGEWSREREGWVWNPGRWE